MLRLYIFFRFDFSADLVLLFSKEKKGFDSMCVCAVRAFVHMKKDCVCARIVVHWYCVFDFRWDSKMRSIERRWQHIEFKVMCIIAVWCNPLVMALCDLWKPFDEYIYRQRNAKVYLYCIIYVTRVELNANNTNVFFLYIWSIF